ncbi:MAG: glycosyltransferase [Ferruginibacter sp.]|nr:glycosyltransferase [Ferruginibacter sp.]
MIIVINTQSHSSSYTAFIIHSFVELATKQKPHQFIFWLTQATTIELPTNCSIVMVKPIPLNKLSQKYWYNYRIPTLLKKCRATHYFNLAGIISNSTTVHQYLFLSLPANEDATILPLQLQHYYGKTAHEQLNKAKQLITFSTQEKNKIEAYSPSLANKTSILPLAANTTFNTLFWEKQEEIKVKYTNGNSYFLAHYPTITKEEFTTLLKAFTQFKQWQKSSMHLIIYSTAIPLQIQDLLNSYKYKGDVQLMTLLPQKNYADILASAYAFIFADTEHYLPLPVVEAMQCQVSVIMPTALKSVFSEAGAFASFTDIKSIAQQLILLYKDEEYRNTLIQKGFHFTTSPQSNNTLWEILN